MASVVTAGDGNRNNGNRSSSDFIASRQIARAIEGNKSKVVVDDKSISSSDSNFVLARSSNDDLVGRQSNDVGLEFVGLGISGGKLHSSSSIGVVQLKDLGT